MQTTCTKEYGVYSRRMRSSIYRNLICDVLQKHHLLNLSEIHKHIPDAHFASIYRNIEALHKGGILRKVTIDKNNVKYELASHDHGHFACIECESVSEIDITLNTHQKQSVGNVSDILVRGLCLKCTNI